MFKIFGECENLNFYSALLHLSKDENTEIRRIVGAQIHEIFKICIENDNDVFKFTKPLINILNSDQHTVFLSPLENLSMSIQLLNLNFKQKLLCKENFDMEKFSLKES